MAGRRTNPLIRELLSRPALNGGWDRLAKQQDAQCRELRIMRKRAKKVEAQLHTWDARWKILVGLLGAIASSVAYKSIVELVQWLAHRP